MNFSIFASVLVIVFCQSRGVSSEAKEEDLCLKQFYTKYCTEKDIKVLEKIQKCEDKSPNEIKEMEDSCYKKVKEGQGKTGEITLQEYQQMECDSNLAVKFEKCMNETLTEAKLVHLEKSFPNNKLDVIAKEIMYCDCDVYGIKHAKN